MTTILVLGGNFGGMTSAFELKRRLGKKARIIVVSRQKEFVYTPSLIWVPFGRRTVKDITFSAEATFKRGDIEFVHDEALRIDPDAGIVHLASGGTVSYDLLVIATGAELVWDSVPGLGPTRYSHSIFTPADAEAAFRRLSGVHQGTGAGGHRGSARRKLHGCRIRVPVQLRSLRAQAPRTRSRADHMGHAVIDQSQKLLVKVTSGRPNSANAIHDVRDHGTDVSD